PADETPFLGEHGEDEIGLLLRQEGEMRLRPLHEALAEDAAGADGDLGLEAVISGAQRIALRIEEGVDAVLLVVLQEAPEDRRRARRARDDDDEFPPAHAGEEEHGAA